MLNENKELHDKFIKEALENAKVVTLGLTKTIKEKLSKLQLVTIADLTLLENKVDESISETLLEEEINIIMSERDKYIRNIERMVNISIDPENCTIGPINKYYEILLAIEKFEESHCEELELNILFMEKNSVSIDRINLILSLFQERDIEWINLRLCDRKLFTEIGSQYHVNSSLCQERVAFLTKRIYKCYKMFIPNSGKTVILDEEFYKDITKKDECLIYFLDLGERVYTALTRRGIYTVRELKEVVKNKKILKIRDIGQKTYDKIIEVLGM